MINANPFTISYGYHLARYSAQRRRSRFIAKTLRGARSQDHLSQPLDFEVVYMVGHRMIPEAALSIQSLLRFAGVPRNLVVVSDGTISHADSENLRRLFPEIDIHELSEFISSDLPPAVADRVSSHWCMGKLALLMSLPRRTPALFVDADVLFFHGALRLAQDLRSLGDTPAFLLDTEPAFDSRLVSGELDSSLPPVNSGLLYLPGSLNWGPSIRQLESQPRNFIPNHFSEQTAAHQALHASRAVPLDPIRYILQVDDRFDLADLPAKWPETACRHYVTTVRHKMWNQAR